PPVTIRPSAKRGQNHAAILAQLQQYGIHRDCDLLGDDTLPERALRVRAPPTQAAPAACTGNGYAFVPLMAIATAALCPSSSCLSSGSGGSNGESPACAKGLVRCAVLHHDSTRSVRGEGPDRHRGLAGPEPVLLARSAGAVC